MVFIPFYSNFNRTLNKQLDSGDADQTPRSAVSNLGLHCLSIYHKRTLGLYRFKYVGSVEW